MILSCVSVTQLQKNCATRRAAPPLLSLSRQPSNSRGMAEEEAPDPAAEMEALKRLMAYPLIKNCDMNEEMRSDCVDIISTAVERYASNYEAAARMVKEQMDKKYNENWIVVVGQNFSFEVTHEVKHVLWMYNCDIAILCYKAGARQVGT